MNNVRRLKIAATILFWFGIILQILTIIDLSIYAHHGTFNGIPMSTIFEGPWFVYLIGFGYIMYTAFLHVTHIIAGLLLAHGRKIGVVLGIIVVIYETILYFLIPTTHPITADIIASRILFVFVIFLMVSGQKGLEELRREKWRPWKKW